MRRRLYAACLAACALAVLPALPFAQGTEKPAPAVRPAPRTPDGRVILGSPVGDRGTWNAIDNRIAIPEKPEEFGDRDSAGSRAVALEP